MALTKVIGAGLGSVTQDGAATFNEGSADVDFRVESNDSANMLFINGGNNQVGIGVDAASTVFHVETSTDGTGVSGDDIYIAKFYNREATDDRSYGIDIHAGSTATDQSLRVKDHDGTNEHFLIKGNGEVNISRDNIVFKTADKGVYLGVTSATSSNLLDDYEEGTFSPVFQTGGNSNGIGHSISSGTYTKVGNRVMCNGFAAMNSKDSSSLTGGDVTIGGLPFTIINDNNSYSAAAFRIQNMTFADIVSLGTTINTTTLNFREMTNGGTTTTLTDGNIASDSYVIFDIAYRVN